MLVMKEPLFFQGSARNGPKAAQLTQDLKPAILNLRHLYDSEFKNHPEARRALRLLKDETMKMSRTQASKHRRSEHHHH